jgi:predicted phosphoribosyltransferase
MRFENRRQAGRILAEKLQSLAGGPVVVLGLPRGGVPVAFEVARALGAPLDVIPVRKLGAPSFPEFALGAIASGGARVLHDVAIAQFGVRGEELERIETRERLELERREAAYRGGRPPLDLKGRTVVLVDDGLATGATMTAAARAVARRAPAKVIVAVPVGSAEACAALKSEADEVLCAEVPADFFSVGSFYAEFPQTSDDEVRSLLADVRLNQHSPNSRAAKAAPAVRSR